MPEHLDPKRIYQKIEQHADRNYKQKYELSSMTNNKILALLKNNLTQEMENIVVRLFHSAWNRSRDQSPFMDVEYVKKIKDDPDIEIGSHSISHPILSNLDEESQRLEIMWGHQKLENLVNKKLYLFAYPYGGSHHFNATSRMIVKKTNNLLAFSTYGGVNRKLNRADIKRITLTNHSTFEMKSLIISNYPK